MITTTPISGTERGHHPYSPSTLANREACSYFKSRSEQHARSIIGTIAHRGTENRADENELTDEDAGFVADCLDFYDRRKWLMEEEAARALRHKFGLQPALIENKEIYRPVDECKFSDADSTTGGYADRELIFLAKGYAEIFDWKFGNWAVERAADNVQGWAYVIGLFRAYPEIEKIKFWFFQPTLRLTTCADFTRDDIPKMLLRIQTIVARARDAQMAIARNDWSGAKPSCPNCNFCDNIGHCTAVLGFACKVGTKFYPLEIPENITPTMVQAPENVSIALRLSAVLKVWAEAFRSVVTNRVITQEASCPPGYSITSSSRRKLIDLAKFKKVVLKYLSKREYESTLQPEFGPVEKLINDKAPRGSKKTTLEAFKAELISKKAVEQGLPYAFLRADDSASEDKNEQTKPKE